MTLTTVQIRAAIRRKILEESTDLVTDTVIDLNMNEAYKDLRYGTFTQDQIESATVSFVNGVGSLPAGFGTLYGPGYRSATDKTPFNEVSISQFDRNEVENVITVDGGQLKVFPLSTASLIIRFWPSYAELSNSQNPELHEYLHELIIYGAMWRIHEDLQNESVSEYYRAKYTEETNRKTAMLSNYQEDNMGGNSMFNGIKVV